jgi:ATP adenylyltransferase
LTWAQIWIQVVIPQGKTLPDCEDDNARCKSSATIRLGILHYPDQIRLILTFESLLPTLSRMECLHAPWRIEYILAPKREDTNDLFVRIAQSSEDEENLVIARSRSCFALLNKYPYSGGHSMVVPYKQAKDLNDLTDDEMTDMMRLLRRCQNALTKTLRADGFNIGINLGKVAGAGILGHLHMHIVPRWNGDTNFMPVLAGTHVVPEALKDIAARLRAALAGNDDDRN